MIFLALAVLLAMVMMLKRRRTISQFPLLPPDLSWERMTELYGAEGISAKDVFEKIGGKLGRGYTGVGGDEQGLILWHPGHPGARIPWSEITLVPGAYMGAPAFRVETGKTDDITLVIPRRFEDRLKARAGAAWPGVSNRTAPDEPAAEG